MSNSKILGLAAAGLLIIILAVNFWPKAQQQPVEEPQYLSYDIEAFEAEEIDEAIVETISEELAEANQGLLQPISDDSCLPAEVDRMSQLFQPCPPLLPIVETITYASRVPWLTGRAAYLGDYASHYHTSKHFISRSLHGTGNYLSDVISKGDKFNVLRTDKEISFHLVLDLSRLKLWVYAYDQEGDASILLKSYPVCAGKLDSRKPSQSLTPTGKYSLGDEIACYQPGKLGNFKGDAREMITIFGVRWIPLAREIANCTGSSKGLGIHGVPWVKNHQTGEYVENRECIGRRESCGCIRLLTEDIEELFSVIVSRPSNIQIVKDFSEAQLPGSRIL